MKKCPICKTKLRIKDYSDSLMVEFYVDCVDGCKKYHYEEFCGNYKTTIGSTVLIESYNTSKTKSKKSLFIFKRKVARLRKHYKKTLG